MRKLHEGADYFRDEKTCVSWVDNKGEKMKMHYYRKTYEQAIKTIVANGFEIVDYSDCFPSKKGKNLFPEEYERHSKEPVFTAWKVKKK